MLSNGFKEIHRRSRVRMGFLWDAALFIAYRDHNEAGSRLLIVRIWLAERETIVARIREIDDGH